jgi:hypothetical protein
VIVILVDFRTGTLIVRGREYTPNAFFTGLFDCRFRGGVVNRPTEGSRYSFRFPLSAFRFAAGFRRGLVATLMRNS